MTQLKLRVSLRALLLLIVLVAVPAAYCSHCYRRCAQLSAIQQSMMGDIQGEVELRYPFGIQRPATDLSHFYRTEGFRWFIATPRLKTLQILKPVWTVRSIRCREWAVDYVFIVLEGQAIPASAFKELLIDSQVRDTCLADLSLDREAVEVLIALPSLVEISLHNVSIASEDKTRLRNSRAWVYWECDGEPTVISPRKG